MKSLLPLQFAVLATIIMLLSGCTASRQQLPPVNNLSTYDVAAVKRVVVLPFKDLRENRNRDLSVVALIPLVPYGTATCGIPEADCPISKGGLQAQFPEVLAKKLVDGIATEKLFQEVTLGYRKSQSDMAIQGIILETTAQQNLYTYGLSLFGGFPWLLYLPTMSVSVTCAIEISCIETASNRTVFSKTYTATASKRINAFYDIAFTSDFFSLKKKDPINLDSMFQTALDEIQADILTDLRTARTPN